MNIYNKITLVLLLMGISISSKAVGVSYNSGPLGIAISDNSSISNDITVTDHSILNNNLTVSVALEHTWIGDLIFTLTAPNSTVITLMDRPGRTTSGFGDSSNLSIQFPLLFSDSAGTSAESAGAGCGSSEIIGQDCDIPPSFSPDDALSTFNGIDIFGTWTLSISDNAGSDTGTLDSWALNTDVSAVPIPAAVWLLGSALVGLVGFKRRS